MAVCPGLHCPGCPGGAAGSLGLYALVGGIGYLGYRLARYLGDGGLAMIDVIAGSVVGAVYLTLITVGIMALRRAAKRRAAYARGYAELQAAPVTVPVSAVWAPGAIDGSAVRMAIMGATPQQTPQLSAYDVRELRAGRTPRRVPNLYRTNG
jgi:hypothetical protein